MAWEAKSTALTASAAAEGTHGTGSASVVTSQEDEAEAEGEGSRGGCHSERDLFEAAESHDHTDG